MKKTKDMILEGQNFWGGMFTARTTKTPTSPYS